MSVIWNDWILGAFIGLGVWATFYLLAKVRDLELQIKVLKSEDKRLSDRVDALYLKHRLNDNDLKALKQVRQTPD